MKQMLLDGDIPLLPQEIIICIFKRLPAKSLIRFVCVSKDWRNIIKSPSFISDHVHLASLQNPTLLMEQPLKMRNFILLDCDMQLREVDTPFIDRISYPRIVGSNYGLICAWIEGIPPYFVLSNPIIGEVRSVPIRTSTKQFQGEWISGFGFSAFVNDYKIVRFFASKVSEQVVAEVYSLITGSWKEIDFHLEGVLHYSSQTVTINGVIFWHGSRTGWAKEDDDCLLSFDIATEVFAWIPWPALTHLRSKVASYHNRLTVYDNKLALLFHTEVEDHCPSSLIDLWVMEEDTGASGKRWNWTKKYTSAMFSMCLLPYSMWQNHIVCKVCESPAQSRVDLRLVTVLALLNPNTYEIKKFTVPTFSSLFNYGESLVSVGKIHVDEPSPSS